MVLMKKNITQTGYGEANERVIASMVYRVDNNILRIREVEDSDC